MPKVLAYRTFDQSGDNDVVLASLTEQNAPPLLVLWLYFTTNPTLLDSIPQQQKFNDIGAAVGLSGECVRQVFAQVVPHRAEFTPAALRFQGFAQQMRYTGATPNCILSDTILKLAPAAKATVTPPVAVA